MPNTRGLPVASDRRFFTRVTWLMWMVTLFCLAGLVRVIVDLVSGVDTGWFIVAILFGFLFLGCLLAAFILSALLPHIRGEMDTGTVTRTDFYSSRLGEDEYYVTIAGKNQEGKYVTVTQQVNRAQYQRATIGKRWKA